MLCCTPDPDLARLLAGHEEVEPGNHAILGLLVLVAILLGMIPWC
jgi:hypothetical protein